MKTTILGAADIGRLATQVGLDALMDEMIARLTTALREYDAERMPVPDRHGFSYSDPTLGLLEWMPILEVGKRATIKVVGCHPRNPTTRHLPTIMCTIGSYDAETGHLVGLVDGNFATALRTGAASAVASTVLASPESRTLGLIGCGLQAVTQFHAMSRAFDLGDVLVYDADPSVSESFLRRVSGLRGGITVKVATLEEVASLADILCTQTSVGGGSGPVFEGGSLRPWIHVNAIGSDFPGKTELPLPLLLSSFVTSDSPAQAILEGECQQLIDKHADKIGPSLAEVVRSPERYRFAREQSSVFDSTGFALEDHVAVELLLEYATELGLGTAIQIEAVSSDPRDPYGFLTATQGAQQNAPVPTDATEATAPFRTR